MNDNNSANVQGLESIVVNGNSKNKDKRRFFRKNLRKTIAWAHNYKNKGPAHKFIVGVLVSPYYGVLGPEEQRKYARKWGLCDSFFTRGSTTFGYALSLALGYVPLFGLSHLLDLTTNISAGSYGSSILFLGSLVQNTERAVSSFVFDKPRPVYVSAIGNTLQAIHYTRKKTTEKKKLIDC
jgi:hypothetical protein